MNSLYESSYEGVVKRWVIDSANIDITQASANDAIQQALKKTFFGSIAGMNMGTYCRINGIQGQSFRPDFREHRYLGDPNSFRAFLVGNSPSYPSFERIVAVEDFVGSGQQMEEASEYLSKLTEYPILLSPILIAQEGIRKGVQLDAANPHMTFQPVFSLPPENAVPESPNGCCEPNFVKSLRRLLLKVWTQTKGNVPTQPLYGPFGCGGVGSLVLTYLNCPDNVPLAIHHKSDSWEPLFRRASREV